MEQKEEDLSLWEEIKKISKRDPESAYHFMFLVLLITLNLIVTFYGWWFLDEAEMMSKLTANNSSDQTIAGYFLMHFNHANFMHLLMNIIAYFMVTISVADNCGWKWKKIAFFMLTTLFATSGAMYYYLNYIINAEEFHLGFSIIIAALFGVILIQGNERDRVWVFDIVIISVILGFFVNISHIGHGLGFVFGILFAIVDSIIKIKKEEKQ